MTRALVCGGLRLLSAVACLLLLMGTHARAQVPNPVLNTVYPPGGQAGTSVIVTLDGVHLDGLRDVHATVPRLTVKKLDGNRFRLDIPAGTSAGVYNLRAVGVHGMSSPRAFVVGNRAETLEAEPNETSDTAQEVSL